MNREHVHALAPVVLRVGLGFVFAYFGWSGITEPENWAGLVPDWIISIASPETLVRIHGIFELIGGVLLVMGVRLGIVSGLLFLNLLHTVFLLSSGPIIVRDVGILSGLLSLFLANLPVRRK